MEGIVLEPEVFGSFAAIFGGVVLFGLVALAIFLGYMSDEERKGRRLTWAEWPLPGTEVSEPSEEVQAAQPPRKAA